MTKRTNEDIYRMALESIYLLARMQRVTITRYPKDGPPQQSTPKSDDPAWDKVIQHCERTGLKPAIVRAV